MILNMDAFRVMDLKPSLDLTIDFFFSSTTRGSGLKGVLKCVCLWLPHKHCISQFDIA